MVGYERDCLWWVFQAINMSAQFYRRKSQISNARISNCDEANIQHIVNNGWYHKLELLELARTKSGSGASPDRDESVVK